MKKKLLCIPALIFAAMLIHGNSYASDYRTFGIAVSAGLIKSMSGSYVGSTELRDDLEIGQDYNIEFERWIGEHFRASMEVKLSWMNFKNTATGIEGESPAFTVPAIIFRNSYHFTNRRIRPFVSAGAGLYFWKFNTDKPLGSVLRFEGEKMQKMSIGLNIGAGLEVEVAKHLSIIIDPAYHYILSRDSFTFGEGFSEQGLLSLSVGIHYYINEGSW